MASVPKAELYEQFTRIGKVLRNPAWLDLLDLLAQGERSVEELAEADAVRVLHAHGYPVRPLDGGWPEWRRAGLRGATKDAVA